MFGIRCDDRQLQDLGSPRRHGLLTNVANRRLYFGAVHSHRPLGRRRDGSYGFEALLGFAQYREAGLSVVEHVPRLAATRFDGFHVVLDAHDCIGKSIGVFW